MSDNVISLGEKRPAALARKVTRNPFLGLHPRRKAITIDAEPDGTFGVRLWPHLTPKDEAFYQNYATAAEARMRSHRAVRRNPEVFQFVVDRSDVPGPEGDA